MYCGSDSLVKYLPTGREATLLRCRAWTCPDCRPVRQKQLVADAMRGAPTVFLTLTIRRTEATTPNDAAKKLVGAWRKVRRKFMLLKKIKHLPFLAIVEATKAGWPHLHIMLRNVWIDQKWLSAQMDELIGSPIVDIRKIDNAGRAAGYVSKYAGKAAHKFGTAKRYWRSKDYILQKQEKTEVPVIDRSHCERVPDPIERLYTVWKQFGWRVYRLSTTRIRCEILQT